MDSVGVRELRQNLSVYLRRVRNGEVLRVTDRGQPVALLGPLPEQSTPYDRLVAQGRVLPATQRLEDLGQPPARPTRMPISAALDEQRRD